MLDAFSASVRFPRLSPDRRQDFYPFVHLLRPRVTPVHIDPYHPAARRIPGRQAGWKRRVLHPVHPDVVDAPRGVPRVVDDQAVCVHGVLHLGRVPPGLAGMVGLFHVLALGPLHLLWDHVRKEAPPGEWKTSVDWEQARSMAPVK